MATVTTQASATIFRPCTTRSMFLSGSSGKLYREVSAIPSTNATSSLPPNECGNPGAIFNSAPTEEIKEKELANGRRPFLFGVGALSLSLLSISPVLAQGKPENYEIFVDKKDGYSYYYPSDWREFDFRGHDSAFKDRYLQLQNVRLSFIPTDKSDIHDLGPMEEVVGDLVKHVYSAPNQVATIMEMRETSKDGKNYCTFEYTLTSPNFSRTAFATIAIGNGRYYTLIVGANERRWRKIRNKLKVVADSFQILDI